MRTARSISGDRGHLFGEQPQRLEAERPVAAVDDEAGAVGGDDHVLAHRLARRAGHGHGRVGGLDTRHDLEQPHHRGWIEEVHAHHPRGVAGGSGQCGDEQRRGVGGQHTVAGDHLGQGREQLALELQAFGRGLDDQLTRRQRGQGLGGLQALGGRGARRPRSSVRARRRD